MQVISSKNFSKGLFKLSIPNKVLILDKITAFENGESNVDVKKLEPKNREHYRIRVGKFRILFIYLNPNTVKLTKIDSRGSVYDRF